MEMILAAFFIFVLAIFLGVEIIAKVPPILHTPLMSGANAVSGIIIIGAIICSGPKHFELNTVLGLAAIIFAMINVAGGYVVTDRMMRMFKKK